MADPLLDTSIAPMMSALRVVAVPTAGRDASASHPRVRPGTSPVVRVMHIVYSLNPGGMEFGVVKLVNGLNTGIVTSSICSTRPGGRLKALVTPEVPVFDLQRRDGNDPRLVWEMCRLFRRERPDIVHTHAWGTMLEGLIAARLAGVPVVVHGEHGTLQTRAYQRWLQRAGWSWVDQVLSVSSRLAERMSSQTGFPLQKIETLRNGVDLTRFGLTDRIGARTELGLAPDEVVIGTVGRLVPVKDQASLVDAMGLLRREGLMPVAIMAGDGPLRAVLAERATALGLGGQIRLLGHRPDVETVLAALDVFVLSSVSEGLSNTILEAMASGLPVVATRVGGADELVAEGVTGLLVPAGDPEALARGLAAVIRDPAARRAMGRAARDRVESEFALAEMVRRYEAMYLRLAGARRRQA